MMKIRSFVHTHLIKGLLLFFVCVPMLQAQPQIEKSPLDERQYAYTRLANGLQVVVVSDPKAQTNGVALVVKAGSFDDPPAFPGLAHFLEHMLFLGTKKFPTPDEFQEMLHANGGSYNATTFGEQTRFYFNVQPTAFNPVLERFADFFISPLLNPQLMERELKAVEAEFQMHQGQDGAGLLEIVKETSNPQHPYARFTAGNLQTLGYDKAKCLSALKDFYAQHYQANRMTLSLVGPQSLPTLLNLAKQHFSQIPNRPAKVFSRPFPFTSEQLAMDIAVKSKGEYRNLSIHFPILKEPTEGLLKTGELISHVLGDEGKGSLLSALKRHRWVTALRTNFDKITQEQAELSLHFSLTPEGLRNIDRITEYTFSYLNLLRQQGIPTVTLEDLKKMSRWQFLHMERAEPMNFAVSLASTLQEQPPQKLLRHAYWAEDDQLSTTQFAEIINQLTPQRMRRVTIHPDNKGQQRSKWYGYTYSTAKIGAEKLHAFAKAPLLTAMQLPAKNPYIPTTLAIAKADKTTALPQKVNVPGITLWHHQDTEFKRPKADIIVNITSPLVTKSAENSLLNSLYAELALEDLREELYPIAQAGANISAYGHSQGVAVVINGYSDKQEQILGKVFQKMRSYQVDPQQFELFKEKILRGLKNYHQLPLYEKAFNDLSVLLLSPAWHPEDLLKASASISPDRLSQFLQAFWKTSHVEMLVNGNYTRDSALALGQVVAQALPPQRAGGSQRLKIAKLNKQTTWVRPVQADNQNHVMVWYLQHPQSDLPTMAKTLLLGKILETPFFQQLRTEQQLGYALNANAYVLNKVSGLIFWIQSPRNAPSELLEKMRLFLTNVHPQIRQLTEEKLASYKGALIQQLREPPRTLSEQSSRWWRVIERGEEAFDRTEQLAKVLEKVTVEDLIAFSLPLLTASPPVGQLMVFSTSNGKLPSPNVVSQGKLAAVEAFKNETEFVAG